MIEVVYDVIIIGSGPAGLTAAIYTSRADLKTVVIAGRAWGGQLMLTTLVENFPGFPEGIMGPNLMMNMRKQAESHGAEILDVDFKSADFTLRPSAGGSGLQPEASAERQERHPFEITTDEDKKIQARSVMITSGAQTQWLGVPGEKEKIGRGVSSCAPCDAAFFRGKNVIVVGGGDAAMEEALVLTKFALLVTVVHRRDALKASQTMQKRAFENQKISFVWDTELVEILGKEKVEGIRLRSKIKNQKSKIRIKSKNEEKEVTPEEIGGQEVPFDSFDIAQDKFAQGKKSQDEIFWEMPIDGVFVAIGHVPNSRLFKGVETDEKGFIKVHDNMKTNIDGVYVAGDVHDHVYKQAITAAGYGCMAALEVERWLRNQTT